MSKAQNLNFTIIITIPTIVTLKKLMLLLVSDAIILTGIKTNIMHKIITACINTIPSIYLPILLLGFDGINLMKENPAIASIFWIVSMIIFDVAAMIIDDCDNVVALIISRCIVTLPNGTVFWNNKNKEFWAHQLVLIIMIGICHVFGYIVLVNFFEYDGQYWTYNTCLAGMIIVICVCIIILCVVMVIVLIIICCQTTMNGRIINAEQPIDNDENNENNENSENQVSDDSNV
jgi:uncharacterized membrane protein